MTAPSETVSMAERLRTDYAWTPRQREVLQLVVAGKTNTQIAETLGLSLSAAKYHLSEILGKLHAESREEAADYWRRYNGLAPRFGRIFRGLTAGPLLKYVAGAGAVGVAAVGVVAVLALRGGPDEPSLPASEASPTSEAIAGTPNPLAAPWVWQGGNQDDFPWVTTKGPRVFVSTGPIYQGGGNFFVGPGKVTAIEVGNGSELWTFDTPSQPFPVAVISDLAVFGTSDGTVFALDVESGLEVWRHEFPGVPFQVLEYDSGRIAVADSDPEHWGPNGIADKTRLAGRVRSLHTATGNTVWERTIGNFATYIAAAPDGLVAASAGFTGSDEVAFIEADGEERWRIQGDFVSDVPVVGTNVVYVPGSSLRALVLDDGRELWSAEPANGGTFVGPFIRENYVVVASNTHTIEAFHVATGERVASAQFPECGLRAISAEFALACGSVVRIEVAGAAVSLSNVLTPQGDVKSATFLRGYILFATNTGHVGPTVAWHFPQ